MEMLLARFKYDVFLEGIIHTMPREGHTIVFHTIDFTKLGLKYLSPKLIIFRHIQVNIFFFFFVKNVKWID